MLITTRSSSNIWVPDRLLSVVVSQVSVCLLYGKCKIRNYEFVTGSIRLAAVVMADDHCYNVSLA